MRDVLKSRLTIVIALLSVSLGIISCGQPRQDVLSDLAQYTYLPAYGQWLESNVTLTEHAKQFCQTPTDTSAQSSKAIERLRNAFYSAQSQWSLMQPLLVGPMSEGNKSWQVQFYPDKRNLVARQTETLLDKLPTLTPQQLSEESVVVQGLTAFEYILFDESIDLAQPSKKKRYCPLLMAIAEHQRALTEGLQQQWRAPTSGMAAQLSQFPNDRYLDQNEALADALLIQINAIDNLKKKLGAPLGRLSRGAPQPYLCEAWRSGRSLSNMLATLNGTREIWTGSNGQLGVRSLISDSELSHKIDQAYDVTQAQLKGFQQPLFQLVTQSDTSALDALYESFDALHRIHHNELAQSLNIQIGFNAADGD